MDEKTKSQKVKIRQIDKDINRQIPKKTKKEKKKKEKKKRKKLSIPIKDTWDCRPSANATMQRNMQQKKVLN